MGTLLFDSETLRTFTQETLSEYFHSFSSLLIHETLENWCFPKTELNIDIYGHATPHIATLGKHMDSFLAEHDDGQVFVELLAEQSFQEFEKSLRDISVIFDKTFRHSYRSRFPNINPGSILVTLGQSLITALENLADEDEGDDTLVRHLAAKREFTGVFLRNQNDILGGEHDMWKNIQRFKAWIAGIVKWS